MLVFTRLKTYEKRGKFTLKGSGVSISVLKLMIVIPPFFFFLKKY